MSKIAFFCIPAHGHTNPTLEVVKELIRLGHEVRYYSYDMMKEKIETTGAVFISCDRYDCQEQLSPKDGKRIATDIDFAVEVLVNSTLAMDEALLEDMKAWQPDCIVADSMALWGKLIALKLDIPFVSSTTTFAFNQYSSKIMKQSIWGLIKVLFQMSKAKRHIKKLQEKGYPVRNVLDIIQNDNETNTIVYTSPEFQPCSETFSDKYSFVGPSIAKLDYEVARDDVKTVYISLGTVNNQMMPFYLNCIEAFKDSEMKVIMSVGNTVDLSAFKGISSNIEIFASVNQIEILQRADVFITHCGMNSVNEALYYQVPLVMFPQTNEQKGVAYRVNELGAGVYLKSNTVTSIRNAVEEVIRSSVYKKNVKTIAESFYKCGGSLEAAEKIIMAIETATN
ncbi:MAG: glucosyltransferase [Tyzzerella sp.]|nr:glucosyltransferase [Tyzzerella sp.]